MLFAAGVEGPAAQLAVAESAFPIPPTNPCQVGFSDSINPNFLRADPSLELLSPVRWHRRAVAASLVPDEAVDVVLGGGKAFEGVVLVLTDAPANVVGYADIEGVDRLAMM